MIGSALSTPIYFTASVTTAARELRSSACGPARLGLAVPPKESQYTKIMAPYNPAIAPQAWLYAKASASGRATNPSYTPPE